MADGSIIDVELNNLLSDDGTTPFAPPSPTGRVFTEEDVARIRAEEKDKVYGRLEAVQSELASFKEQVGSLTAAEQRREAQLVEEQKRLEEEARQKENEELDAKTLLQRREEEWKAEQARLEQQWNERFQTIESEKEQERVLREKEREFNDLKEYAQQQVAANSENIAPQLLQWISGNSRDEIDAAVARAIETTNALVEDMQQTINTQQIDPSTGQPYQQVVAPPAPPATPGTRVTAAPGSDPGAQYQTLTAEQIKQMPMDQYAKMRGQLGIGGQSQNRGLYG
jgi:hypothetical protein